jgi:hypothetical protein
MDNNKVPIQDFKVGSKVFQTKTEKYPTIQEFVLGTPYDGDGYETSMVLNRILSRDYESCLQSDIMPWQTF